MAKLISISSPSLKGKRVLRTVSKNNQPTLLGHENLVDSLFSLKENFDKAKVELENARLEVEPLASDLQREEEGKGTFTQKVRLHGTSKDVTISFGDKFSEIDISCKDDIETVLGAYYSDLFEEREEGELIQTKLDDLRNLITASGRDPDEFLTSKKYIIPVDRFRARRFELRKIFSDSQNVVVDNIVDQTQYRPTLSGWGK